MFLCIFHALDVTGILENIWFHFTCTTFFPMLDSFLFNTDVNSIDILGFTQSYWSCHREKTSKFYFLLLHFWIEICFESFDIFNWHLYKRIEPIGNYFQNSFSVCGIVHFKPFQRFALHLICSLDKQYILLIKLFASISMLLSHSDLSILFISWNYIFWKLLISWIFYRFYLQLFKFTYTF